MEISMEALQKTKTMPPYQSWTYIWKSVNHYTREKPEYIPMFTATLFTIARLWNQPNNW
jgi:hypothetical protein